MSGFTSWIKVFAPDLSSSSSSWSKRPYITIQDGQQLRLLSPCGFKIWIKIFLYFYSAHFYVLTKSLYNLADSYYDIFLDAVIYYNSRRPPARVTFSCLLLWIQDLDQKPFQFIICLLPCTYRKVLDMPLSCWLWFLQSHLDELKHNK